MPRRRQRRNREELGPAWRPTLETREFVARGTEWLSVEIDGLRSRRRSRELVRARELLMILGVERYGLKEKDLARELRKSPDGMTHLIARAVRRRTQDNAFSAGLISCIVHWLRLTNELLGYSGIACLAPFL